jgi:hypothetical protein
MLRRGNVARHNAASQIAVHVEALKQLPQSPLGSHERASLLRRRCSTLKIPARKEQTCLVFSRS